MYAIKSLCLLVGLLVACRAWSQPVDYSETNRYSVETLVPTLEQQDLLSVVIDVKFPNSLHQVGDAIERLITPNGYQLALTDKSSDDQYVLLTQPLPAIHRQLGPMRLKTALYVLAGNSYQLAINPVKRTIAFRLKDIARTEITQDDIDYAKQVWNAKTVLPASTTPPENCIPEKGELTYGPIKPGETLLAIAGELLTSGHSIEQMLIALLEANPQAFPTSNINHLSEHALLRIPPHKAVIQIDHDIAKNRVQTMHRKWKAQR